MANEFNDVVKQGYVKIKSKNVGVWQKKWAVLKKPSSKGPLRLEKYTEEKSAWLSYQNTGKFIDLTYTSDVYHLPSDIRKNTVAIINKDGTSKQLVCDTELDTAEWVQCLRGECRLNVMSKEGSDDTPGKADRFNVYLLPSHNLSVYGESILILSSTHLNIYDVMSPDKKIASWPYTSLRKYGGDNNKFTFESGRHCDTGEGLFVLNTPHGNKIYERVQINSISIAESYRLAHRQDLMSDNPTVERATSVRDSGDAQPNGACASPNDMRHSKSLPTNYRAPLPLPRGRLAPTPADLPLPTENYEVPVTRRPLPQPAEDEYTMPVGPPPPPPPPLRTPDTTLPRVNNNNEETAETKYLSEDFVSFLSKQHDSS